MIWFVITEEETDYLLKRVIDLSAQH